VSASAPTSNKKLALLIGVLAALLAYAEILGKNAQTSAISHNIEASNLWGFFQAKTIRKTEAATSADLLESLAGLISEEKRARVAPAVDKLRAQAAHYESEPATQEGRKELAERAQRAEADRAKAYAAYHDFEYAAGAIEIAIVLASAAAITEVTALALLSGSFGAAGVVLCLLGLLRPEWLL
jgi:hypothetical protein